MVPTGKRLLQTQLWWSYESRNDDGASIGGIIRNHHGKLIVAYTSSIKAMTPLEAEIQALYQGIIQCKVNHARRVIIEGDCLVLVENIQNQMTVSWDIMHWWMKLLQALEGIPEWYIRFRRRSKNAVAHNLSKLNCPAFTTFKSYLPPAVQHLFVRECQSH